MSDQPTNAVIDGPLRLVCSEIWGGNRPVHRSIELPGIRGALFSKPCQGGRGGDVHYLSVCGSGILSRMCLADVVGHGDVVAATSSEMHAHLRHCMNTPDQRRVLSQLNARLERLGFKAITTAAALTFYAPTNNLSFSYAGHPPGWYFYRARDEWLPLELDPLPHDAAPLTNVPMGIEADARYTQKTLRTTVGDRLILVTDGVLEAMDPAGQLFGDARLAEVLHAHRASTCEELGEAILSALSAFCANETLGHDDVTFLVAEFVPGPKGPAIWHAIKNRITRPRGNADALQPH